MWRMHCDEKLLKKNQTGKTMRSQDITSKNKASVTAMNSEVKISHYFTPELAGLLVDAYVAAKGFSIIMNNSKAASSSKDKAKESLDHINTTIHACTHN
ncbi:hypothetical protein NG726_31185, partial [Pseudomonas sp. MOB-449]|nr:hypothetical protein [Pseudomonas sp. MOB-449]